jgi:Skp family chaperone for outer membrane proteins
MLHGKMSAFVLAMILGVTLAAFAPVNAQSAAPVELPKARPVKIAVVDIESVFNKLDERERVQADLAIMGEKAKADRDKMEEQIKALQADLELLSPNSPQYTAKVDALSQKTFEAQAWMNWKQNAVQRESKLRQIDLYRKINLAAADLARENGYDMVIFKEPPIERMAQLSAQEANQAMSERKLIYFAPDLEITDLLIIRMNNEYKNRKVVPTNP